MSVLTDPRVERDRSDVSFPSPRFPAGVAVPVVVLVVGLLVLAALSSLVVRVPGERTAPAAVVDADRRAAATVADAVAGRLRALGGVRGAGRLHPSDLPSRVDGPRPVLVRSDGRVLAAGGDESGGGRHAGRALIARAAAGAAVGDRGDVADTAALADPDRDPALPVTVASFVRVPTARPPGGPVLAVVAVSEAPPVVGADDRPGLVLGAVLAGLAVVSGVALTGVLVRPVRRLRDDGRMLAAGGPSGWVRRSRVREVDAVAAALCRDVRPAPRRAASAGLVVALVGVAVLGVLASGVLLVRRDPRSSPVADRAEVTRAAVENAGDALRRRLVDGDARVRAAAAPQLGDPAGGDLVPRADALAAVPGLFRAVSVVAPDGVTVYSAGDRPLRPAEPVDGEGGVRQLNTSGPLPIVVAAARTPDGAYALVGEYDVAALARGLRVPDTHVVVADAADRVVLDGDGFRAFTLLDVAARDARRSPGAGAGTAVSLPVGDRDAAAGAGWSIIGTRRIEAAEFRRDTVVRGALVVVALGTILTVAVLMWIRLVVLGPLRRAGRPGGLPRPVERLDEVGAVVAYLNVRDGAPR